MFHGAKVAVILPCHNEAGFIGRAVETLPAWVDHIGVVDDCSTDGTAAVANGLLDDRVTVVRTPRNLGTGGAVVTGLRWALELEAHFVVVSNGDAQMSGPEVGDLLWPLWQGHADMVKGNRLRCPGTRNTIPLQRRTGIVVLSALTRWATGYAHLGDSQCGYFALTAQAVRRLPLDALWRGYGFPNDLLIKAAGAGLRVEERPIRAIYGDEVSGLRVRHLLPIGGLLLRGAAQRWRR